MSHEYRMEQLRAAIAAARKNFKKDANFFVVGLTYGCRRSWKRTFGNPARFRTRCSMCNTLSGDMGPPVGDGNTHSLLPVFLLCCIRTSIASADSGKVR